MGKFKGRLHSLTVTSDIVPHMPQVEVIGARIKRWRHSWTLWVNLVTLVLAVAETQVNLLQPLLPVNVWHLLAFVLPIVNALLRFKTSVGLALPGKAPGGES
jgi:hypothetical protein